MELLSFEMHENFWQHIANTAFTITITLVIFWAGIVRKMVTKDEVCEMIEKRSPYAQDRQYIMERLAANKEIQKELSEALKHNSEVMTDLKVEIASLGATLVALESRMDRKE